MRDHSKVRLDLFDTELISGIDTLGKSRINLEMAPTPEKLEPERTAGATESAAKNPAEESRSLAHYPVLKKGQACNISLPTHLSNASASGNQAPF